MTWVQQLYAECLRQASLELVKQNWTTINASRDLTTSSIGERGHVPTCLRIDPPRVYALFDIPKR